MFCRNCGNELNEKAIACPKCGCNPHTEKKHCPGCGVNTEAAQVMCTKCGVALTGSRTISNSEGNSTGPGFDASLIIKNKILIFASLALLGCLFPWVKMGVWVTSLSYSLFSLSTPFTDSGTILVPALLFLLPLFLIGIIVSQFMPEIKKYNMIFVIGSVVLIIYAAIGLYQFSHPSMSYDSVENYGNLRSIYNGFGNRLHRAFNSGYSVGFGFYFTFLLTATTAVFSFIESKKPQV